MKALLALLLLLPAGSAAQGGAQRIEKIEKRVTKVEKRVTALEKGRPAPAAAVKADPALPPPIPKDPILVHFIKKRQFVSTEKKEKMGVELTLEFENSARRGFFAFSGELLLKDEAGEPVWSQPYAYSDPIKPGERVRVELPLQGVQGKAYLKFVKARELSAVLTGQQYYAAD
jgi:hypothetical protein